MVTCGKQVHEIRICIKVALSIPHTVQMIDLKHGDQFVCHLFQRLDLVSCIDIPVAESLVRVI